MPDEQNVQNERNDRTREAKTGESPRGTKSKVEKKRDVRKIGKKKKERQAWNTAEVREKDYIWEAELSRRKRTDRGNAKMQKQ